MRIEERMVSLARGEIGYLEKASRSQLEDKTANAGSGNFTKYARDIDALNLLNGAKQGYPWCTIFYIWLIFKACGAEHLRQVLYLPERSLAAGCKFAVEYYKAAGAYGKTPKVGAQIFFGDTDGVPCHTGLVTGFDGQYVYTIEGNTDGGSGVIANGGGVAAKSYRLSYSRIHGYGYPNFALVEKEETMSEDQIRQIVREEIGKMAMETSGQIAEAMAALNARITAVSGDIDKRMRGLDSKPSDWILRSGELEEAKVRGITDGTRPQGYAKREEVAAMVLRALRQSDRDLPAEVAAAMATDSY